MPLLILTHYHADHTGGAADLIARFRPALILTRSGEPPHWLVVAARRVEAELRSAVPGESITVGAATWRTAWAGITPAAGPAEGEGEGTAENDASVVGVAESGGLRVLLAGDAEPDGQAAALREAARVGVALQAHVLKLPHHGSSRQLVRFFAASGAGLAVASAGEGNDYGHPAQAALDLAAAHGMHTVRTDSQGSLAVSLAEGELHVVAQRS